jgi:hypothetical protein
MPRHYFACLIYSKPARLADCQLAKGRIHFVSCNTCPFYSKHLFWNDLIYSSRSKYLTNKVPVKPTTVLREPQDWHSLPHHAVQKDITKGSARQENSP